jgi:CBS-domain-containing membrane protein
VIGSEQIHQLGYGYVLSPVGIGIAILIGVAYVTNNLPKKGKWPEKWLPFEK